MKRHDRFVHLLSLIMSACLILSCSMIASDSAATQLAAAEHLTPEVRDLISSILSDIVHHEYRFGADARRQALAAVSRLEAQEFGPMVRAIAGLQMSESEERRHDAVVAISGALATLTVLRDPEAQALNRRRLADDMFRGFAILNLKILEAWHTAPDVESELLRMPMSNVNGNEVVAVLDFLQAASAAATGKVCAGLDRVRTAYPECWRAAGPEAKSFCINLVQLHAELRGSKCLTPAG